jgi:hypothetical protein
VGASQLRSWATVRTGIKLPGMLIIAACIECVSGPFRYRLVSNITMQDMKRRRGAACSSRNAVSVPRMYTMKSSYLTPVACAALLFGCAIVNAQTSNPPSDQSTTAPVSDHTDTTKGNNLVGTTPTDQTATPPSAGQDKANGNDLAGSNPNATHRPSRQASAARPDFNTLDTAKRGRLTADDVKSDTWLSQNFTRCDTDHDGTLSRAEYVACK